MRLPLPASSPEAPEVFVCQSRGREKTASRVPQGCLGSALLCYCFKNPAQNSQVPHAKSKATEAGAGRWGHIQSHLIALRALPDCHRLRSSQPPTRDVSLLCRWRCPWSEAASLPWEGLPLVSVRALHPLPQYEGQLGVCREEPLL